MTNPYHSTAWRQARDRAVAQAKGRCQRCGRKGVLVAHHLDERGPEGPRGFDPTNLVVLCRPCHQLEHGHTPHGADGRE